MIKITNLIDYGLKINSPHKLYIDDNINVLKKIDSDSIDLIYLDPPFFSQRNYGEFDDRFKSIKEYIEFLRTRVIECYRVLKPTGSIYLHCDWHASHYLKVMMDKVFGYNNFRNEIVWCYSGGGKSRNMFARKHDIIFFYTKSDKWIFNLQKEEVRDSIKEQYNKFDEEKKMYYRIAKQGKWGIYKEYAEKMLDDWWDISPLGGNDTKERLGYPTQKPEKLLERIIKASSNEGDVVLDPFCGCGTSGSVSLKLNRKFIGIDNNKNVINIIKKRIPGINIVEGV